MANTTVALTALDFDTLRANLANTMSSNPQFRDYDFAGPNLSVLLDILAQNSWLNAFYLNMVASEMFLDSAQLYNSVVSRAKELNYPPQSAKSSVATVTLGVSTVGIGNTFTVPKGTPFIGTNSNGSFSYVTDATVVAFSGNGYFTLANLQVYEGSYLTDTWVYCASNADQTFVLSNPSIDAASLSVTVTQGGGAQVLAFKRAETLSALDGNSQIYFLQGAQDGRYEIVFGDGLFGLIPDDGALVSANYRVAAGPAADGVSRFQPAGNLGTLNGGQATVTVTTGANSAAGALPQTIDSIRFYAPRYYAAQQRAVSTDDYRTLVLANFVGEVADCGVYGGETLNPKQYGAVVVCLKPPGGLVAADYVKNAVVEYLTDYSQVPGRIIAADPMPMYLAVSTTVTYDSSVTTLSASDLQYMVGASIQAYDSASLESFDSNFRYSKFVTAIDGTDGSIVSNQTTVLLTHRIAPVPGVSTSYTMSYYNALREGDPEVPVMTSSGFAFVDSTGTLRPLCFMRDDGVGNIEVYTYTQGREIVVVPVIGTIDYADGTLALSMFTAASYVGHISLMADTLENDVRAASGVILSIDPNDVSVTMETL